MAVSVERESGHHTVSATASQKKMTVFLTHLAGMPVNRKYIAFCAIFTTKKEESQKTILGATAVYIVKPQSTFF